MYKKFRFYKAMKLSFILMFIMCLQASAGAYSQNGTVTLNLTKASIEQVLNNIEARTPYKFVYNSDHFPEREITLKVKNRPVSRVLLETFDDTGLSWELLDNDLVAIKKATEIVAQAIVVKGTVTDSEGTPLAGVSVAIKERNLVPINMQSGTTTDELGGFSIVVPSENVTLVFSYIGFKRVEYLVKNRETWNIRLEVDDATMDEVVVTGISERSAETFTGSAVVYRGDDLVRVGNQNVFQSLKNLDPTIYIMESLEMGSDPNSLPDMNMRGGTSFNEPLPGENLKGNYQARPNQPLFILDGFETTAERVFDLDMHTIESLTLLRDASAKALYGSKAANGVVVVETKRIDATKPRITYNGSLDLTMPDLSSYELVSALEKLDVEYREGVYPETSPAAQNNYYNLRKTVLGGLDTYWLSKPVRMGYGQRHGLNVELGKEELRTNVNISHFENVGVMKGSDRKTLSGDLNLSYLLKRFRFQNRLHITNNKSADSPYGSFSRYTLLNSYVNPYDEHGNLVQNLSAGGRNPLLDAEVPTSLTANYFEFTNNFEAEYTIIEGLRARARFGISRKTSGADRYYPSTHSRFASYPNTESFRRGQYESNNGFSNRYSGDFYVNYNTSISETHNFFLTGGFNIAENRYREEVNYTEGFPSALMNDMMFAYQYDSQRIRPSGVSGFTREYGMLSMLSYTYMDRFLFDGTFRVNASSVFGNENLFAPFWSLGVGWNLHKETWLQYVPEVRMLKIRGSLGSTGNQNFLNNKSLTVNNYYLDDRYGNMIGSYAANMANPELKWEQKMDYDVGLDADVYGFALKFDVFRSITENLVTLISTAPSTGFSNVSDNLGKVENKGFEASVAYTVFNNRNGFLRISTATTRNTNTILEISDAMRTFNERQLETINAREDLASKQSPTILYYDGLPMNTIWAVPSYGIDPAMGIELLKGKDGLPTYIWKASDMVPSGISVPKWRGNIGFNGEYKGFGVSVIFTYIAGGQLYNHTLVNKIENVSISQNFDRRVLTDRWGEPGQMTQYKRNTGRHPYDYRNGIYWYSTSGWAQELTRPTQRFVQDQDELNISSISLSYDVNRNWLQRANMERLRVTAYMNDVAKFSTIGIERGTTYPFARTVSFKLTATF